MTKKAKDAQVTIPERDMASSDDLPPVIALVYSSTSIKGYLGTAPDIRLQCMSSRTLRAALQIPDTI